MANYSDIFKSYLESQNLYPNTWKTEEGSDVFEFQQKLKSGPSGRLVVIIDKYELVSIYALDYVTLTNSSRKDYMYKLLNELNIKYTYYKFTLSEDNEVIISCYIPFNNNFNAEIVLNKLGGTLMIMDKEYPNLMKAMWS